MFLGVISLANSLDSIVCPNSPSIRKHLAELPFNNDTAFYFPKWECRLYHFTKFFLWLMGTHFCILRLGQQVCWPETIPTESFKYKKRGKLECIVLRYIQGKLKDKTMERWRKKFCWKQGCLQAPSQCLDILIAWIGRDEKKYSADNYNRWSCFPAVFHHKQMA